MKQATIIIALTIITLFSCKKDTTQTQQTTTTGTTTSSGSQQDSKLLGIWLQDSLKNGNNPVTHLAGGIIDSNFVSLPTWKNVNKNLLAGTPPLTSNYTWSTSGNNLTLASIVSAYTISGTVLMTNGGTIIHWYHKVN